MDDISKMQEDAYNYLIEKRSDLDDRFKELERQQEIITKEIGIIDSLITLTE